MTDPENLDRLRKDLNALLDQATTLSRRLDEMEGAEWRRNTEAEAAEARRAEAEAVAARSAEAVAPPPLPPRATAKQALAEDAMERARDFAAGQGNGGDAASASAAAGPAAPPAAPPLPASPPLPPPPPSRPAAQPCDVRATGRGSSPRPVAQPQAVREEPGESWIERMVRQRVAAMRERTRGMGWELALGTYWLPRVGIVLLAIAVVFLLTLAVQRFGGRMLPHIRVGIGYATCAAMLGFAWRFEKRYAGLARVLFAGGFGVTYFVTFATHYIKLARVFDSPTITLVLLGAIVVAWAAVAQVRRSQSIAVLVTVLGHFTVALSTHTLDEPSPFAAAGIVLLAAGSGFFLLRNGWYYVASLGIVGAYANYAYFLARTTPSGLVADFVIAMAILGAYFLIFALSEFFSPERLRRHAIPTWFRTSFVTLNSACFFAIGTVLVNSFEPMREHQDLFRFAYAAVLLALGMAYLRLRAGDPLFNAYFTKASVIVTLGLAARYRGDSLAAWLAAETFVLMLAARRSGLVVTRVLALLCGALAFGHGLYTVADQGALGYAAEGYGVRAAQAVLGALALLATALLYQSTDWSVRSPRTTPFSRGTETFLWQLDLLAAPPEGPLAPQKPLGGLLLPYAYGLAGGLLLFLNALALTWGLDQLPVVALMALTLTAAAAALRSRPIGLVSFLLAIAAIPVGVGVLRMSEMPVWLVPSVGLLALAACALASEERLLGRFDALVFHRTGGAPYLLYGGTALVLGFLLTRLLGDFDESLALTAAGVACAGLFLVLHPRALSWVSGALLVWACGAWFWATVDAPNAVLPPAEDFPTLPVVHLAAMPSIRLAALVLIAAGAGLDRYYHWSRARGGAASCVGSAMLVVSWLTLIRYLRLEIDGVWGLAAVAGAQFAFLAWAIGFRSRTAGALGVLGTLYAAAAWGVETIGVRVALSSDVRTCALLVIAACAALDRYWHSARPRGGAVGPVGSAMLVVSWVVLLRYLCLEVGDLWTLAAIVAAQFAYLAWGIAFRSRTAGVLSLIAAVFATAFLQAPGVLTETKADLLPMLATYALPALLWTAFERFATWWTARHPGSGCGNVAALAVGVATALWVEMLFHVPAAARLNATWITIQWFALAVALFAVAKALRQRYYRYAALAVIALSLGRAFIVDMKGTDPILRIAAFALLGIGLLTIAYFYFRLMERSKKAGETTKAAEGVEAAPPERGDERP